jgi:hypothetical protein
MAAKYQEKSDNFLQLTLLGAEDYVARIQSLVISERAVTNHHIP